MLEVTETATTNLKSYLDQNNVESAIRIALMQGGWAGPALGLALDESKDNDSDFEFGGITFLVDKTLMDSCGSIKIDFIDDGPRSGFAVSSAMPIGGGGGCASGSCSQGSCG